MLPAAAYQSQHRTNHHQPVSRLYKEAFVAFYLCLSHCVLLQRQQCAATVRIARKPALAHLSVVQRQLSRGRSWRRCQFRVQS